MLWAEFAKFLHIVDDVVAVHHAGLVAVDDGPFALVIATNDSNTVSIWVRSDNEVSVELGTEVHTHGHSLSVLWVRTLHGREIAIDDHLLRYDVDILEAPRAKAHWDDLASRAVERSINDVEVFLTENGLLVIMH